MLPYAMRYIKVIVYKIFIEMFDIHFAANVLCSMSEHSCFINSRNTRKYKTHKYPGCGKLLFNRGNVTRHLKSSCPNKFVKKH